MSLVLLQRRGAAMSSCLDGINEREIFLTPTLKIDKYLLHVINKG